MEDNGMIDNATAERMVIPEIEEYEKMEEEFEQRGPSVYRVDAFTKSYEIAADDLGITESAAVFQMRTGEFPFMAYEPIFVAPLDTITKITRTLTIEESEKYYVRELDSFGEE